MILREPEYDDCEFIAECYKDWPKSRKGRVFPVDVRDWINRFRYREPELGLVGEQNGTRVGFLIYEKSHDGLLAQIHDIVVTPLLRKMGNGSAMLEVLTDRLVSEGVLVAEFAALPGAIALKTEAGGFEKIGEGIGDKTGLPLVKGRVTA